MKKKYKLSKNDKEILNFWKKWFILHGQECYHPIHYYNMLDDMTFYSENRVDNKLIWNWSPDILSLEMKFTEDFLELLEKYD